MKAAEARGNQTLLHRLVTSASRRPANAYLLIGGANATRQAARGLAVALADLPSERAAAVHAGRHPDVLTFEPEGVAAYLASQGDQIQTEAARGPLEARRKILILEQADVLGGVLESSLLKTLEEPAPSTSFLLCAADAAALPDTIVSRCIVMQIPPLPPSQAGEMLATDIPDVDPDEAARLVRATGTVEFARDVLASETWRTRRSQWLAIPSRLRSDSIPSLMREIDAELDASGHELVAVQQAEHAELAEFLGGAAGGGRANQRRKRALADLDERHKRAARAHTTGDQRRLLATLAGWYRDVLAVLEGVEPLNTEVADGIRAEALGVGREGARTALACLSEAAEALSLNATASLVIEDVLLQLRYLHG